MGIASIAKMLMLAGGLLFMCGLLLSIGARFGLGQLPGDLTYRRGNVSIYAPIVTSIVLSVVVTVVLNIILRYFK